MMDNCTPITRIFPACFAWVLLLASTGLFFAFPCRYLISIYSIAIPIFQSIITFFVLTNFALATFVNPGVIPKAKTDELRSDGTSPPPYHDTVIRGIRVRLKWCVTCQFYRPPRCVHCGVCDMCIETFDHHCPWVNNCIGRRNYRYFFMFLLWLSIHMISILILCAFYLKDHLHNIKQLPTIMTLVIVGVIVLLFFPLCGLTVYHMMLIFQGRTTNEQVTGKFPKGKSPYTKGCCRNIMQSLCVSPFPRYKINKSSCDPTSYYSARKMSDQHQLKENNSSSLVKTNMQFNYMDNQDYMMPKQSLSTDCEEAPPTYLNRSRLHLSLSESIYTRAEQTKYQKNSRALTPPVPTRFDCSRRSLPPQNRMYAPSPHYVIAQSVHSTSFVSQDGPQTGPCGSTQPTMYYPYYQDPSLIKYDYGKSMGDVCGSAASFYPVLYKRKDGFSKSDGIPFTSPDAGKVMVSETCCLGNQTVDKLQEIANRTMIGGQCADVSVLEAFPKGCSSFQNSPNKERLDGHQLLIAQTPQQLFVNNCVDCQQSSSNHSCQSSISGEFARTPGNRPLSFVKAMEMSEAIPNWSEPLHQRPSSSVPHDKISPQSNYTMLSPQQTKAEHEVSYEISV